MPRWGVSSLLRRLYSCSALPAPEQVSLVHKLALPDVPLQSPHAPPSSGDTSCSGRAWPAISLGSLSAVLRTSFRPSSVVSRIRPYRVRVVSLFSEAVSSADYPFTSSCSPPRVATTQLLSVTRREAPPVRDFHPLCMLAPKRTRRGLQSTVTAPPCPRVASATPEQALIFMKTRPFTPTEMLSLRTIVS